MKKLLLYFDTDKFASSFDTIVAYDAGVDQVIQYAGMTASDCAELVEGAIYTRPPKKKQNTAILIGGSDLRQGHALMEAITAQFFDRFRVSVMLDSCGCNTTAAAAIALLEQQQLVAGKVATVLAGTGPVGQRAATLLAQAGAKQVRVTSRTRARAEQVCQFAKDHYQVELQAFACNDEHSTSQALCGAQIAFCAGKTRVQLLSAAQWQEHPSLEVVVDVNTCPPLGAEGLEMADKNTERAGCVTFGGIGVGTTKLATQRACIATLFTNNTLVLDAKEIYQQSCALLSHSPSIKERSAGAS